VQWWRIAFWAEPGAKICCVAPNPLAKVFHFSWHFIFHRIQILIFKVAPLKTMAPGADRSPAPRDALPLQKRSKRAKLFPKGTKFLLNLKIFSQIFSGFLFSLGIFSEFF